MASASVRSIPHKTDRFIVKAVLLITSTFTVMAGTTIAPSLPAMQNHFIAVVDVELWVRLVLTLPALFIVIGAPIVGYLIDKVGRKRLLMLSALLYGIAGTSGFLAENLIVILVGRAFLGLAVAGIMTCISTLISDYYTGTSRARLLGFQSAFSGIGGTVFLLVGGMLANVNWRNPFLIYSIPFVVLPFIWMILSEPQHKTTTQQASQDAPHIKIPIGLMLFVYGCLFFIQATFYIIPTQLPFHLEALLGANSSQSGMALALMTLCFAFASSLAGWFAHRFDHITMVISAFLMTGVGYVLISLAQDWTFLLMGLPMSGFGIGLLIPNLNVWLASETPLAIRGRVFGGFTTSVFLGQFLSPFLSQPLISATTITTGIALNALLLLALGVLFSGIRTPLYRFTQWTK